MDGNGGKAHQRPTPARRGTKTWTILASAGPLLAGKAGGAREGSVERETGADDASEPHTVQRHSRGGPAIGRRT